MRRFHGRKAALGLFGVSLAFSFFTAFHFDLFSEDVVDYLDLSPTIHAKDLLARRLAAATEKDRFAMASIEWEESYEQQENYRQCAMNQPMERPLHGCTTNSDTKVPYCQVQNLRIDTSKISGPLGGEPLDSVMGRDEDVELPRYLLGAFTTDKKLELAEFMNRDYWFYLLDVFMAMDIDKYSFVRKQKCTQTLPGVSLLITRYEYVDMYHTLKDLWNAFMVLPLGVDKPDRVIFLDSHAKGWLDTVWNDLFGKTLHIKELQEGTCLETAIFVPPGYSSVLWPLSRIFNANRCEAMSKAFVDFVIKSYGLESIKKQDNTILILDKVPHIEHPRSVPEQKVHDSGVLLDMQAQILEKTSALSVQVIDPHRLSFKSQLKLIRQAHILMGMQDSESSNSQLAMVMFLQDEASFIEIKASGMDMRNIARWRPGVKYRTIYTTSSHLVEYEVVPNVKDVLTPGWDATERRYPEEYYVDQDAFYNETEDQDWNATEDDEFRGNDIDEEGQGGNPLWGWASKHTTFDTTEDYRQCALNRPYPRPIHGCRVDPDTRIPYCHVENLRIDVSKVDVASGGEYLETVLGRAEEVEFPKYGAGALTVEKALDVPSDIDKSMFYYLSDVVDGITVSPGQTCSETVTKPTLFITRYEYVSLFHTMGDWWHTFMSLPEKDAKNVQLVFLDGHAEGFLDGIWWRVFAKYEFVKQLPDGGVCYKNAIFIPPGYSSVLWPRDRMLRGSPCPSMASSFVASFVKAYGLENESKDVGRITILDRVPFVSHPRRDPSQETSRIQNLSALKDRLEKETNATIVEIIDLEQTKFRDQLRVLRQTHVLIGHSEAGLSHLMFLSDGAHVMQFDSSTLMQDFVKWKPSLTLRSFGSADSDLLDYVMNELVGAVNYALSPQADQEEIQ